MTVRGHILQVFKRFCSRSKPFFVTTPIYYVNASPHIGHLYTSVVADCIQRWQRLAYLQDNILFCTGTDEHGTKIQRAADSLKLSPKAYTDKLTAEYDMLSKTFGVEYTHFIRTTSEAHKKAVQNLWKPRRRVALVSASNQTPEEE